VLQQRPMTVILADEVELALEHAVARIWVEKDLGGRQGKPADFASQPSTHLNDLWRMQ
jgi:hypothetical protein